MTNETLENSRVVQFLRRCRAAGRTLLEPFRRAGNRLARYVKGSAIYRWLTAEPEPGVIVIDLRETYTVGPIIRAVDRVLDTLEDSYENSRTEAAVASVGEAVHARPLRLAGIAGLGFVIVSMLAAVVAGSLSVGLVAVQLFVVALALLALRSTRTLEEVLETRVASTVIAAFEPPEPPATANERADVRPTNDDARSSTADGSDQSLEEADNSRPDR